MFWNDIREIKLAICRIDDRLEYLDEVFDSENEYGSLSRIHNKLDDLLHDLDMNNRIALAQKTLDKFEDYMKNVDKLNAMINEFKGCVALARSAIAERKQMASECPNS